ncbi:TetR/AcrR family transcriptional regulator [Cryptosporangium aurantiacum]|uniref:Transcriptional regulator, TetR family n=1 Tax=Cryptosporangium aurantiacum TaxID=134849 RepID=A0A1M7RNW1_9ACTN|nr:TetR/AcrR family transcriptional regulator [Cryptosporangium aurantiacum]SHN47748.1 transcriptional regulator, TetR family [Cryptosporangium aurantiacum]
MARDGRTRLLTAALTLLDERGVVAVSAEDIRVAAGASVGSLYHHFPTGKPALVSAVLDEWLGRYRAESLAALTSASGHEAGIRAVVGHFLQWAEDHPAAARVLLRFEVDPPPERPLPATPEPDRGEGPTFLESVTTWLTTHGHPDATPTPIAVLLALWVGPAKEYTRGWLAGRSPHPPHEVAAPVADAAWQNVHRLRPAEGGPR